jgi:hypothetical protein
LAKRRLGIISAMFSHDLNSSGSFSSICGERKPHSSSMQYSEGLLSLWAIVIVKKRERKKEVKFEELINDKRRGGSISRSWGDPPSTIYQ